MKTTINTTTIKNLFSGLFIVFALFLSSFSFAEKGYKMIDDGGLLQNAILNDNTELALKIIKRNPQIIYSEDKYGDTPLHDAAEYGNTEVATLLLDRGADVNARDNYDNTPLHNAVLYGNTEVATLLLDRGADVAARNNEGYTLSQAVIPISLRADVAAKNNEGYTPLHYATEKTEVATLLLDRGADVNAKDNYDNTPLHKVAIFGNTEVATLLLDRGADVDARNIYDETPLHKVAERGRTKMATLLLDRGANVAVTNNKGKTPLDITSNSDMENILIEASGCFFSCFFKRLF